MRDGKPIEKLAKYLLLARVVVRIPVRYKVVLEFDVGRPAGWRPWKRRPC